jgi:23S rRNA (pseudouridine1915-N3)-methyltransferase
VRISILFIGKPRDPHANALAGDFSSRIAHYVRCEMREIRPDRYDPWEKHPPAVKICLDPVGRRMDSHQFTGWVQKAELEARDLVFIVGGADGLPPGWRERADLALSLSPMTLPHELARAMLAEQIYRAFTTLRGHPYPR